MGTKQHDVDADGYAHDDDKPKKQKKEKKPKVIEVDAVALEEAAKQNKGSTAVDGKARAEDGVYAVAGGDDEQAQGGRMSRSKVSLVPKETATYLQEVMAHFKTLVDAEEKTVLVDNVLSELAG